MFTKEKSDKQIKVGCIGVSGSDKVPVLIIERTQGNYFSPTLNIQITGTRWNWFSKKVKKKPLSISHNQDIVWSMKIFTFSQKTNDKSSTPKCIHILFKLTGEKDRILRNVSIFQNVSFSISLALARNTGSTTVHAWLPNDSQIPRLLQVLGRKPTVLRNFLIRKLLDLGQAAII